MSPDTIAQPKRTNKLRNEINRFLKKAIADGSARAGQSAEIVRGRGAVIKDSQLGGIHRKSAARAEKLGNQGEGGAAQAKRIGHVVDRAKRRLRMHNQAKGVGQRAADILKTLPIPELPPLSKDSLSGLRSWDSGWSVLRRRLGQRDPMKPITPEPSVLDGAGAISPTEVRGS